MRRKIGKMNSKAKSKTLILITLGMLFALSQMITISYSFNTGYDNKSLEYSDDIAFDNENLKLSKISGKISINGNSGWLAFKNAGKCTGFGTYSEPYVIEDLEIDGGGTAGSCIRVFDSNVHFRIENCTAYNSSTSSNWAGIYLGSVYNAQLIDNNLSYHNRGIFLSYSHNNTISGNIANNNRRGIILEYSKNNTISGNIANNNSITGLDLVWFSNNNTMSGNTANFNDMVGIAVPHSDYNLISGNTANYNDIIGIDIAMSENNTISENTAYNNGGGISISGDYNIVSGNTANNNDWEGIGIYNCVYNKISGNTANNNKKYGIELDASNYTTISGNTLLNNNEYGIYCGLSYNNYIYINCLTNNTLNAYDDGVNNQWDNGTIGNYWDDYNGIDADNNGVGDTPYNIPGSAGSQDSFPLMECQIPTQDGIPIELIILISVISGGAVIGVAVLLLIRRKRKRIE